MLPARCRTGRRTQARASRAVLGLSLCLFLSPTSSCIILPPVPLRPHKSSLITALSVAMSLTRDDAGNIAHLHEASGLLSLPRDYSDASSGAGATATYVILSICSLSYVQIGAPCRHRWRRKPTVIQTPGRVSPCPALSCTRKGGNGRGCRRSPRTHTADA